MLTAKCIHPGIMKMLSLCGHGSKVLIADGNYPLMQKSGNAEKVYLGLTPGLPTVTEVLKCLHSVVEFEKAEVMFPEDESVPEIFAEFKDELKMELDGKERFEYYELCNQPDVVLAISTGEQRTYANILLTIGCA